MNYIVHGILQARILEWVAGPFSRESSQTQVSNITGGFFTRWITTVWITTNCGKSLKRWEYQTKLLPLRNLYAGQEATVRTEHGTMDWFQIGKGVHQGHILSPCLFNLYAEYIMRNARLDEVQAEIKIDRRNINNLRYADDTTLMAESEKELKTSW